MDGAAFDRLSVVVHRLRDAATRRQALRMLAAGGIAGLLAHFGAGAAGAACVERRRSCSRDRDCCGSQDGDVVCDQLPGASDRNGDRCCGRNDARCASPCDCCAGFTCDAGGRCRSGSESGGQCGLTVCQPGWRCCQFDVSAGCYDPDYLHCCTKGLCSNGWDCCGSAQCCSSGWKCCGHGRCCPNGWRCGKSACIASQTSDVSGTSARTIPFGDPVTVDEQGWIKKGWFEPASTSDPT